MKINIYLNFLIDKMRVNNNFNISMFNFIGKIFSKEEKKDEIDMDKVIEKQKKAASKFENGFGV